MKTKKRFNLSQKAHKRLHNMHSARMKKRDDAWIPAVYHSIVHDIQATKNEILSRSEREKIFIRCCKDFYD